MGTNIAGPSPPTPAPKPKKKLKKLLEILVGGSLIAAVFTALLNVLIVDPAGNYMTIWYGQLSADLKGWLHHRQSPTSTESATVTATPTASPSSVRIETPTPTPVAPSPIGILTPTPVPTQQQHYDAVWVRSPLGRSIECEIVPIDMMSRKFLPYLNELVHDTSTQPTCNILVSLDQPQDKPVGSCPSGGWAEIATVHYKISDPKTGFNREGSVKGKPHCDNSDPTTDQQAAFIAAMAEFTEAIAQ
jgi:hypothetical protein